MWIILHRKNANIWIIHKKIDVFLNYFEKVNGKINISVDVDFKEKYLTENILKFYIRKQIKQYLKLFSIDEDVKMDFNFIKN